MLTAGLYISCNYKSVQLGADLSKPELTNIVWSKEMSYQLYIL